MDQQRLRRADFKTGIVLVALCLWLLSVTFAFMPFRETYGGVENAWYVSPWIFPAVVLVLLLAVSVVLVLNAIRCRGHLDIVRFAGGGIFAFRLTAAGRALTSALALASAAGMVYLVVNIEEKIRLSREEAKWLADPSAAEVFEWSSPLALVPLAVVALIFVLACAALAVGWRGASRAGSTPDAPAYRRETSVRVGVITLLFAVLVYVLVPRVDFFVSAMLFLYAFTVSFHVAQAPVQRMAMGLVIATALVVVLAGSMGANESGGIAFGHGLDVGVLLITVAAMLVNGRLCAPDPGLRRAHRQCLLVAWLTPMLLVPAFRFGLLVPMPHEGIVIEAMHQLRYLAR